MTIITAQEVVRRDKEGGRGGYEMAHHASDTTETKNEQDCWAEFTELRAGSTNSRRRLSHQVSAECLSSTQAPERLRSRPAEPTHKTLPMEKRRGPSPGANYPRPCHQRRAVSFKNHQHRRCTLNRSGLGIVGRLLLSVEDTNWLRWYNELLTLNGEENYRKVQKLCWIYSRYENIPDGLYLTVSTYTKLSWP